MHTISVIHLRVLRETTCVQMNKTTTTRAPAATKIPHLEAHTHIVRARAHKRKREIENKKISYRNYSLTIDRYWICIQETKTAHKWRRALSGKQMLTVAILQRISISSVKNYAAKMRITE